MTALYVSVVIPTHNRPALLARCLAALEHQTYPAPCFEVIVVIDGGVDAGHVCCGHCHQTALNNGAALRVLHTARVGPAAARNHGWQAARGDIIAFTDDDVVPGPGWLAAGVRAFAPDIVGVAGWTEVPTPPVPTDHELMTAGLENAPFTTCNVFYRRCALERVGGFDERYRLAWREDSDLYFRLCKLGGRMVIAPDAHAVHPVRSVRFGHSLFDHRKMRYNALLYKEHPRLYRSLIQRDPPWRYYQILAAVIILMLALVGRRKGLALAAFGVWLALTGQFCAERLDGTSHQPRHVAEMVVTSALIPPVAVYWRLYGAVEWRVFFL